MQIIHPSAKIHPTAIIGDNVTIDAGAEIGAFCIIGARAEHKDYWIKPLGRVWIGENCVLTGHCTVDASTTVVPTIIASGVWLLKHSHVGHDAFIGMNTVISCGAKIGGHAQIMANCNIGLNATVHQWVTIPKGCMIGMGAAVIKKTQMEPYCKYAGVPAKLIGENKIKDNETHNNIP